MRRPGVLILGLLAVSLAVNLVGAGYLATVGFRPRPQRTVDATIEVVSSHYPDPVSDVVRQKLADHRTELKDALDAMKSARRGAREAMSADPFDRARVDAASGQAREKAGAFWKVIHGAVADALQGAPAADRAKIDRRDDD